MQASGAHPTRRRNGRLAACTNCHARKVACDHGRPSCLRCRRRNEASSCAYADADANPTPSLLRSTPRSSRPLRPRAPDASSPASRGARATPPTDIGLIRAAPGTGYIGSLSYKPSFEEAGGGLVSTISPSVTPDAAAQNRSFSLDKLPAPLRESCLYVLRCLPGQANEAFIFVDNDTPPTCWANLAVDSIMRTLQGMFRDTLPQGDVGLGALVELLNRNSAQPMCDDDNLSAEEWVQQFTGQNIRWESIGLLWPHLARVSDIVDSMRNCQLEWIGGTPTYSIALVCLEYCINISRHFSEGSMLLLDLCRRRSTLASIVDGDAAFAGYESHGVASSMLFYLGLHDQQDSTPYSPSFSSETRRRMFCQTFVSDKLSIAFTGRPALITGRYCSTPLPLDLRDQDLIGDEATLARAIQDLDPQGWNTKSGLQPATTIRARYMMASIRDELMELYLTKSAYRSPESITNLLAIRDRANDVFLGFPDTIVIHPEQIESDQSDPISLYIRILVRLEHLQNLFFVERLLVLHGQPDSGHLLAVSFEMVSLTLKFWTHKDRFPDINMRRNFGWVVLLYAAPGAGILCQELRRPSLGHFHPKQLSRSNIVQQLSLLIGFFSWFPSDVPNWELVKSCRIIIERVLDLELNGDLHDAEMDPGDWGVLDQPDFNFDLLDTFDWVRTDV
ncbi:hypothetical protein B0I35DRAFT_484749 [Stachybotrys elegans]|uniref:Zn(2)-C6 fungal-type domain-containing protein n=1 Tax=Stachybotrys elegans TaxID=80388 RepID=A0A8K0S9K6_9HYPO|nr:hypothetical protein B0I35DRAFT_484749 [Stachybotrys elegans]